MKTIPKCPLIMNRNVPLQLREKPIPASGPLLRVISLNVNGRLSKRNGQCRDAIAAILKTLKPDIICLQEVNTRAQGKWLSRELFMHFDSRAWTPGGMTVLSRKPISSVQVMRLRGGWYNSLIAVKIGRLWVASRPFRIAACVTDGTNRSE